MSYADRTLTCRECGANFIWTAGEQEFYASRGLENAPSRCPECRQARRSGGGGGGGQRYSSGPREMHQVVCAQCGNPAQVPFVPRGDKPVYCSDCFSKMRGGTGRGSRY
jgi:CxxC-x17-CxxC domain-containing protein